MPKKRSDDQKTIYQICREKRFANRIMACADKNLEGITESKLERIEYGVTEPTLKEVYDMSVAYKTPELCTYYCQNICKIGETYAPKIKSNDFAELVLEILATLNTLDRDKNELIKIAADGKISNNEMVAYEKIEKSLSEMSDIIASLNLWVKQQKTKK